MLGLQPRLCIRLHPVVCVACHRFAAVPVDGAGVVALAGNGLGQFADADCRSPRSTIRGVGRWHGVVHRVADPSASGSASLRRLDHPRAEIRDGVRHCPSS